MSERKEYKSKGFEEQTNLFEVPLRIVEELNTAIKEFDNVLRSFDSILTSNISPPPSTLERRSSSEGVPSPSYPGQSRESYCLECLPPGTLIYASDGIHGIEYFGNGYRSVLTHKGRFEDVLMFFSRNYKGPIRVINTRYTNIPLKLTPDHPVLVLRDGSLMWVKASDLSTSDLIAFPRIKDVIDLDIISDDVAELMGWYLARGSYQYGGGLVFRLDGSDRIYELIRKSLGVEPEVVKSHNVTKAVVRGSGYERMFRMFGRGKYKNIPNFILYLPERKQYAFLRGYLGSRILTSRKRPVLRVSTVSANVAYKLRLILFRLGILHLIIFKPKRKAYEVRVYGDSAIELANRLGIEHGFKRSGYRRLGVVSDDYIFIPIRNVGYEEYEGPVYNLHVRNDESYVTIHGALHNCLTRHYLKALGLLEEAERFSLSKGEIVPAARQRIEAALKEVVTAEEDLGTPIRDPELAKMIDEINVKQREFRKWLWSERLLTTQKDLSKLREAISKMKDIVELTRRASEYYDSKYGRCGYCESLAREISSKFNVSESEVLDAIYGLASDSQERITESADKLKRLGVFEYTMQRVKEMLSELKGGK